MGLTTITETCYIFRLKGGDDMARAAFKYIEVSPDIHRKTKAAAAASGITIREYTENALISKLAGQMSAPDTSAEKNCSKKSKS
jgi:hypothetical protein